MAAKPLNTPLTAAEIAALCDGVHHGADFQALDVSTDSRRLQAGELFIALRGPNFRGEDFLAAAKGQGAVAAIVAEYQPDADLPQIVVADTLAALQALARDRRERSQAQFFAITGSNGKTSTKEILQRLLQTRGQTLATLGNLNNDIGVPLTLLRLRDEDRYAVIEMGANHPGEIAALAALARPDVALITNVAPAHLAGFGTLEGVIAAKSEIYAHSDGAIVLNLDLPAAARWQDQFHDRPQYTFSLNIDADVTAHDLAADGSRFVLRVDGSDYPVTWQLAGRHNIMNALAACTAARLAGVTGAQMQATLTGLALHQSRLAAIRVGAHTIYDDTYNANPASFKAAIDVLAAAPQSLIIAGAMGELGAEEVALHHDVATYAATRGISAFWSVGDGLAQEYGADRHFADTASAGAALAAYLADAPATVILVKGSRSARMEGVLAAAGLSAAAGH